VGFGVYISTLPLRWASDAFVAGAQRSAFCIFVIDPESCRSFRLLLVNHGSSTLCASAPTQHRNLGYGLQFATARRVAGEDRHAVLNGLHEPGASVDIDRPRPPAFPERTPGYARRFLSRDRRRGRTRQVAAGNRGPHDAGAGSRPQPAARCLSACGLVLIISTRLAWSASP
jgi:hypothetical protein